MPPYRLPVDVSKGQFHASRIVQPQYRWWLVITSNYRCAHERRPNWWHRLWQRLLLGWTWAPIESPAAGQKT